MQAVATKLRKLSRKSVRELRVRGRQEAAKFCERAFGLSVGEMSDRAFLHHVNRHWRGASAEETSVSIASRFRDKYSLNSQTSNHSFFSSLSRRANVVATMERRFARERQAIIERADRAIAGRFDLLGLHDLSFGNPPDWLLEPISGKRAPLDHWSRIDYLNPEVTGDKKLIWELNRHAHFVTMGQAYWLTGDETYAEAFVAQATSWMDNNPPNRGINWASSLELAFRSIGWLWALHLFAGSVYLKPAFVLRLLKHLVAHGLHIQAYLSHYFSPNTHLTGEALGLFYLGTALGELRLADNWRKLGIRILLDEMSRQIREDGVYFEQTTYYHRYTADFYIHLLALSRATGIKLPAELEARLTQLVTHLLWIIRPDGSSPLIGDDDGGRLISFGARDLNDFRDTLAIAAALFGRSDWKHVAGDSVEILWLLGPEALERYDNLESKAPEGVSHVFKASGYSIMRDGWSKDSTYALMDCGPHGSLSCGHAHADALSIEFAALGRNWIVDPGTFTYTANSSARDQFRSTQMHSTVTVDGKSQSIPAGPFSWDRVAQTSLDNSIVGDGFDYIEGSHDGYERLIDPVRHSRAVIFPKASERDPSRAALHSYLVIRDVFRASDCHRYLIRYALAPNCSAFSVDNRVVVTGPDKARLDIITFSRSALRARIVDSWVSRAYGQREPALAAIFEAEGKGPQEFITFIIPALEGQSIFVEQQHDSPARAFQIVSHSTRDYLLISNQTRLHRCGPVTAAAKVAWARFDDDEFVRAFLICGHELETDDGFSFRATAPVNHCAIRRTEDAIVGSVNGGTLFNLATGGRARKVVINGASFDMSRQSAVFSRYGLQWDLVNAS